MSNEVYLAPSPNPKVTEISASPGLIPANSNYTYTTAEIKPTDYSRNTFWAIVVLIVIVIIIALVSYFYLFRPIRNFVDKTNSTLDTINNQTLPIVDKLAQDVDKFVNEIGPEISAAVETINNKTLPDVDKLLQDADTAIKDAIDLITTIKNDINAAIIVGGGFLNEVEKKIDEAIQKILEIIEKLFPSASQTNGLAVGSYNF